MDPWTSFLTLFILLRTEYSVSLYLKKGSILRGKTPNQYLHSAVFTSVFKRRIAKRSINIFSNDPVDDRFNEVLVEIINNINLENDDRCHLIIYHNSKAVSEEQLKSFLNTIQIPSSLIDINSLQFSLLTLKRTRKKTHLLELLESREYPSQCRILLAWSSADYQRLLLLIARAEPHVIGAQDFVIFPTYDRRLDRFMPQIRKRIMVRKVIGTGRGARGRRALAPEKYLVERVCEWCKHYSLEKIGEFTTPGGWTRGSATPKNYGLHGRNISVTYTNSVPNVFPVVGLNGPQLEGLEIRMLKYTSRALNFSYRLYEPDDKEWGRKINGSWTGKVGEISKGNADLAIAGIVYTFERASVVKYASLFHHELWGIVCPSPFQLPLWPYVLFPFYGTSTIVMFSFVVILHIFVFLSVTVFGIQRHVTEAQYINSSLSDSCYRVCQAGVALYIRFLIFLYFYSLYSTIMVPKYEDSVKSVEDLLMSGRSWGIVKGTTVQRVLSTSLAPSLEELASSATYIQSISEGWRNLERSGLCLVGIPKRYAKASINSKYTTECGEPAIQVSHDDLHTVMGGWVTPYGTWLGKRIHSVILQMEMFGLMDKWREDLFEMISVKSAKRPCIKQPISSLSFFHLRLIFSMLFTGYVLSLLMFVGECINSKYLSKKAKSTRVKNIRHSEEKRDSINKKMTRTNMLMESIFPRSHSAILNKEEAILRFKLEEILKETCGLQPS